MSARINWGGANVRAVADLSDDQVTAALEHISMHEGDRISERLHGVEEDAKAWLELYCAAYEETHGSVYATP